MSDNDWWRQIRRAEANAKAQKFINDNKTITLVNTNAEALNIAAEYAVKRSEELDTILWQWPAKNTIYRHRCFTNDTVQWCIVRLRTPHVHQ